MKIFKIDGKSYVDPALYCEIPRLKEANQYIIEEDDTDDEFFVAILTSNSTKIVIDKSNQQYLVLNDWSSNASLSNLNVVNLTGMLRPLFLSFFYLRRELLRQLIQRITSGLILAARAICHRYQCCNQLLEPEEDAVTAEAYDPG